MFFDTHAHYDDKAFDDGREDLLNTVFASGVEGVINPGCDITSSRKALEIAFSTTDGRRAIPPSHGESPSYPPAAERLASWIPAS